MYCEDRSFIRELRHMREIISAISNMEETLATADISPLAKAVACDLLLTFAERWMTAYKKHLEAE